MKEEKIYRSSLSVKPDELNKMSKGKVFIKVGEKILEGTIDEILLASNDSSQFFSFNFKPTEETKKNYPDYEIPTNFAAGEFDGIAGE